MSKLYVGYLANTHGLRGDLKLHFKSSFPDKIKKGTILNIDNEDYTVSEIKPFKNYYLVCFEGYKNINKVLDLKAKDVFIERENLKLEKDEYVDEELVGFLVYDGSKCLGKVEGISYNNLYALIYVNNFYIPLIDEFILRVDLDGKKIYTKNGKDLMI